MGKHKFKRRCFKEVRMVFLLLFWKYLDKEVALVDSVMNGFFCVPLKTQQIRS